MVADYWERKAGTEDPDAGSEECRIIAEEKVRARKQHTCRDCGKPIEPGEVYRREVYVWDGKMRRDRTHVRPCWQEADREDEERLMLMRAEQEEAAAREGLSLAAVSHPVWDPFEVSDAS